MARLNIDTGIEGNPSTGDTLRTAMNKINTNFEELYLSLLQTDDTGGYITTTVTNGDIRIQPNGTGSVEIDTLSITNNSIASTTTNSDINITGNGTGGVQLEDIKINGTVISSDSSSLIQINENLNVTGVITGDGSGLTNVGGGAISSIDADSTTVSNLEVDNFKESAIVLESEGISSNDNDTTLPTSAAIKDYVDAEDANIASDSMTFTNKTFDADGTGNSITNIDLANLKSDVLDTDLSSVSGADDTIASAKAIKAYVDAQNTAQAITFVGDDSSGTAVNSGETFKVAGTQNITTAVSGDTLTITGPDLSAYATQAYVDARDIGDLSVTGSTISAPSNADLTLTTSGTGSVSVDGIQIKGTELSSSDSTQITIKENLHVTGNITGTLSASGNDTEVQFNNSGAFAGDSGLTFDSSGGKTLKVGAGGGTVKANSFQGADSVSTGVTFQSDNGSGVKANHLQIQSHTGSVQTVFPSGAVDFTSAGSVDFTGTTVTGLALTMVGDDSSGTAVNTGETFKFAGATGVTTAVSGDTLTITGPDLTSFITASSSDTLTNKTFDVEGTGNSISNIDVADFKAAAIVTEAEGIGSNDNDTTLPTSAAVKDYVDTEVSGVSGASTGDITFTGSTIQSPSNADITLDPSGTGRLEVVSGANVLARFNGSSLANTQTVEIDVVGPQSNGGANFGVGGSGVTDATNNLDNKAFFTADSTLDGVNIRADKSDGFVQITAGGITSDDEVARFSPTGITAEQPVTFNAGYIEKINSLTSSSTITVDCAAASIHTVTLGTSTEFNISNLPTGGTVTLIITQDGTGGRTASFGTDGSSAVKFPSNSSTLSTGGGDIDVVTIINDGTNFLGNIAKDYRSS